MQAIPSSDHLPEHLSLEPGYAAFRPAAEVTLAEAIEMIDGAIAFCCHNEIHGLLVDITGLTGFDAPSVFDRFFFMTKWAESANGLVAVAMIAPAIMIDEHKIGVTIGTNRGFICDVFTSESEARKWLAEKCFCP